MPGTNQTYWEAIWEERFEELLRFKELYGTTNAPKKKKTDKCPNWEKRLGNWVGHQREFYKKGMLKQGRYRRLLEIGFEFEPWELRWEEQFRNLMKFKNKYGHVNVPQDYNTLPGLGSWVCRMRTTELSHERRNRLNKEGFIWNSIESVWFERYQELIEFKTRYGHTKVPNEYKSNKSLGIWVQRMREAKKESDWGTLTNERKKLLNKIDFVWDVKQYNFDLYYKMLLAHRKKHGHVHVNTHNCKNSTLKWWVFWLRHNKSKLKQFEINKLNKIGFEWDPDKAIIKRNKFIARTRKEKGILTLSQVTGILGIERSTIYNWRKKGWIQYYKSGKNVLFEIDNILKVLERPELINYRDKISKFKELFHTEI